MTTTTVFQLDSKPTWLENIAVRPNGSVLTTRLDLPELWEVDPKNRTGRRLLSTPDATALTGIAEVAPDVFAIGAGKYSLAGGPVPRSWTVWLVDLTGSEPAARRAAAVPEMGMLNGLAAWDADHVLAADSLLGSIHKISLRDGSGAPVLEDESMTVAPGAAFRTGVNGIKVRTDGGRKFVYYTSSTHMLFCRVPVDTETRASGPVEVLARGFVMDDFCFGPDGAAYILTNVSNLLMRVAPGGEAAVAAGSKMAFDVAGGTACAFGRGQEDGDLLYVSTGGAAAAPINGEMEAAKVVAVVL